MWPISSSVFHFDWTNISVLYRYTCGFRATGREGQGSALQLGNTKIPKGTRAGPRSLLFLIVVIEMTDIAYEVDGCEMDIIFDVNQSGRDTVSLQAPAADSGPKMMKPDIDKSTT
jgi:hypothetical protein